MLGIALLQTHELTVEIAGYTVCQKFNLAFYPGQCWGMLGINGVGKTTLIHALAGLHPVQTGDVLLGGVSRMRLGRKACARYLGVVFQDEPDLFPNTVLEVTLASRHPHLGYFGRETEKDYALAEAALATVGLTGLEHRAITTLSGGEHQRLRIAAFLAQDTLVGLLDEPTNHLDPSHQIRLLSFLRERTRIRGGALLMALHDVNLVARFCDHCLLLFGNGEINAGPTNEMLTTTTLQRLYHHPMIAKITPWGKGWLPA
ncbi:ABC transporter [Gammaproteobacteria bacterium]